MDKTLIIGGTGYIGSALFQYLNADTVDLEWFGNYVNKNNLILDYRHLTRKFLAKYQVIVLLAGHSSVQMCQNSNPFHNNITNFVELLEKLDKQRLIYASSSSVYGGQCLVAKEDDDIFHPKNAYDVSKQCIDYFATLWNKDYYGLRFGTVNGPSPNFRSDLMINKMVRASVNGTIEVRNPQIRRPILGMNDLCRAVKTIIESPPNPGIYNLASINSTVGDIARAVAKETGAKINILPDSPTYDFTIDTTKFQKNYNFEFVDNIDNIISAVRQMEIIGYGERSLQVL